MPIIRSPSNPALKRVRSVNAGREPDLILLEGDLLVDEARLHGFEFELCLVSRDRPERLKELEDGGVEVRQVEAGLLGTVSRLVTSPGILALVRAPARPPFSEMPITSDALVVVAAGVADPGNLGTLARTAEAAGVSALIVIKGGARVWGEKALRGSMGSLLRLPVFTMQSSSEAHRALAGRAFRQVLAATRGGRSAREFDWSGTVALWLTAETGEIPEVVRGLEPVTIPMTGSIESLNVSAAAAVLLFAAGRV